MATNTLAEAYTPIAYNRAEQQKQLELNRFLSSGIMVNDALITQKLSGGANTIELPQWKGLGNAEPNYSNDVTGDKSVPKKIDGALQKARTAIRNDSWAEMTLAAELNLGKGALEAISGRIGGFWATDDEKRLIQMFKGIEADNSANDAGDMVYDVSIDTAAALTDAERISGDAIAEAMQTMGDHKDNLVAIAMHSRVQTQLNKTERLEPTKDSQTGKFLYNTYNGLRVIVDDSLAPVQGAEKLIYTTILFAAGTVGYGNGPVEVPSALDRDETSGNGGGESFIHSRVNSCAHPYGFAFTSSSVAGITPTRAELALAANWDRVTERKLVGVAFLKTNG